MTRINCIEPKLLSNKHIVAEYREMLRLRHVWPRKTGVSVPSSYRLGKGHVTFFYDKGAYLAKRHEELRNEMASRGFTANYELDLSNWPQDVMNDWLPTVDAKLSNVARIINRMVK